MIGVAASFMIANSCTPAEDGILYCKFDHHFDDFSGPRYGNYDPLVINVKYKKGDVLSFTSPSKDEVYCYGDKRVETISEEYLVWVCIGANVIGGVNERTGSIDRITGEVEFLVRMLKSDGTVFRRMEYFGLCKKVDPAF